MGNSFIAFIIGIVYSTTCLLIFSFSSLPTLASNSSSAYLRAGYRRADWLQVRGVRIGCRCALMCGAMLFTMGLCARGSRVGFGLRRVKDSIEQEALYTFIGSTINTGQTEGLKGGFKGMVDGGF